MIILYFTTEAAIELMASLIMFTINFMIFQEWRKHQDPILLSLFIIKFSMFSMVFVDFLAILLHSKFLFQLKVIFAIPLALSIEYTLSQILFGRVNQARFSIAGFLATITFFAAMLNDSVLDLHPVGGSPSFASVGLLRTTFTIFSLYLAGAYVTYSTLLVLYTPPRLKRTAKIHFLGAVFFGPITMLFLILKINWFLPGSYAFPMTIGALLMGYSLISSPEILYALPFKAYRLLLVQKGSGLVLYNYIWTKPEKSSELVGALLESINQYANYNLSYGRLKMIQFDDGIILFSHVFDGGYYVVVESSHPTPPLQRGLLAFISLIEKGFPFLSEKPRLNYPTKKLGDITLLIEKAFPYVHSENLITE